MAKEDVDFTFDTTAFTNGVKQVSAGIANVTRNVANMAKKVSSGVINAIAKIGLLKLAFSGVKAAIAEMPEIGRTFKIAKDIIMKNFLFPVRKAIFPMLQKLLDWVRDNRAMFVKWGQTLVTVFNVVSSAIERVIEIGKGLLRTFGNFFNRVFGTQIKGLNDLLNIMSFKFAVAVEFLSRLLEPVIKIIEPIVKVLVENFNKIAGPASELAMNIIDIGAGLLDASKGGSSLVDFFNTLVSTAGDVAKFVLEITNSFVKGLKPHLSAIVNQITKIGKEFKSIVDSILTGEDSLQVWKDFFKWLGSTLGSSILLPLKSLSVALRSVVKSIEFLKGAGVAIGEFFGGGKEKKVKDAIIKPTGEIIRTDPADYLFATKNPENISKAINQLIESSFRKMFPKIEPIQDNNIINKFFKTDNINKTNNIYRNENVINKFIENKSEIIKPEFPDIKPIEILSEIKEVDKKIENKFNISFTIENMNIEKATEEEARKMSVDFVSMFRDEINKEFVTQGLV